MSTATLGTGSSPAAARAPLTQNTEVFLNLSIKLVLEGKE